MSIFASGADKVRNLRHAMGGAPPSDIFEKANAALQHHLRERSERRKALRAELGSVAERKRELLFSSMKDDPRLRKLNEERKATLKRIKRPAVVLAETAAIEPQVIVGSNIWIDVPPYPQPAFSFADRGVDVHVDINAGTYSIAAQSIGDGNFDGGAGLWSLFFSPDANAEKRFSALLSFDDNWWDSADGYVAHNFLQTHLWVWGYAENRFVIQTDIGPSQNDGVGWFEDHSGDPAGLTALATHFPARANSWYAGLVWSEASVYADSGFFGFGASSINFQARVPFVVYATDH